MAGTGVDQVVAIPTGGSGPSAGSGSTMARISGWWHRLPTWGKVVAVIVVIGLIVLVWLFIGGVAGSSNGGSAASLGGSGGAGGGGGGFGSPPSNSTQPPQQLPSGPGGTDQPSPVQSTQPTTTTTTTFPSTIVPTGKMPASDLHSYTPTTTAHGTTGTSTPVQHSEPVVSSTPAHANSGSFTTQPYYVTPSYPPGRGGGSVSLLRRLNPARGVCSVGGGRSQGGCLRYLSSVSHPPVRTQRGRGNRS